MSNLIHKGGDFWKATSSADFSMTNFSGAKERELENKKYTQKKPSYGGV